MVSLGLALASGAHPRRISFFKSVRFCFSKKKSTPFGVLFFLLLVYTLDTVLYLIYYDTIKNSNLKYA